MTKTRSSATTSHATPVKANTGKLVVKNKILRIGEEPPVTALKQSSLASVSTATMASFVNLVESRIKSGICLDSIDSNVGAVDLVVPVNHNY